MFGDEVDDFKNVADSMVHLPFDAVYAEEGKLMAEVTHLCNVHPAKETTIITALPKIPKIEQLLQLTSSQAEMIHLELLAKAYEEEECFVNVYWVITKMKKLDVAVGNMYFNEFRKRHNDIFLYGSVLRRAGEHR